MIRFIRFSQSMIFMSIGIPVKVTAVNDSSANLHSMSVHIFGCGMGDDISSPFKRTAVYRCSEGVVYNKRNFMFVSNLCEFFNIKNYQGRVCDGLCEKYLCGVLQTGIEVSFCLKIEELSHFIRSIIFISGTLINRECAWFTLRRSVTGMETFSLDFKVTHEFSSFLM